DVYSVDEGAAGLVETDSCQIGGQAVRRGLEQRRMERSTHRQHDCALCTFRFGCLYAALDRRLVPGDDYLAGRVEVDRLHHLSLSGFATCGAQRVIVQPEYCSHGPLPDRHRFLHRLRPEAHEWESVAKSER